MLLLNRHEPTGYDLLNLKVAQFRPKLSFRMELKNFVIEVIHSADDLRRVIELRRHSFIEDFIGDPGPDYIDFDEYDLLADHVIVRRKDSKEILSAYRMINSEFTTQFYSAEQFTMNEFACTAGIKVELGRAVVHKNFRNGLTLSLVWKGIAHYAALAGARHMFGCASIKSTSQRLMESMYWHLYNGHFDGQYNIGILPKYQFKGEMPPDDLLPWAVVESHVPPLLRTYLKAGAKICSRPAVDLALQCTDFFTVLDLSKINAQYQERYFG